jgi:hypothetical protein
VEVSLRAAARAAGFPPVSAGEGAGARCHHQKSTAQVITPAAISAIGGRARSVGGEPVATVATFG